MKPGFDASGKMQPGQFGHCAELEQLYESAPIGLCLVDCNLRFIRINERMAAINGKSVNDHLGKTVGEAIPELASTIEPIYREVIETGKPALDFEIHGTTPAEPDAEKYWLVSYYPLRDDKGTVSGVSTFVQDITERKTFEKDLLIQKERLENQVREQMAELRTANADLKKEMEERRRAEEMTQQSEEKLRSLLNACTDSILLTDTEGMFIDLNETVARRIGERVEDLVGTNSYDTLPRSVAEGRREKAAEVIRTKEPVRFTDVREGRLFNINIFPVPDIQGEVERLAIYAKDITTRRIAEDRLRESEENYRALTDSIPGFIMAVDREGTIHFINRTMPSFSSNEVVGTNVTDYTAPEHHQRELNAIRETFETGKPNRYEIQIVGLDGYRTWFETRTAPIEKKGRISEVIMVSVDITDRKRTEKLLQESEERYRAVFEQAADSIVLINADTGAILEFNERAHKNLGYTHEEFQKTDMADIEASESTEDIRTHTDKIKKAGGDVFETKHKTKSGEIRDILVNCRVISVGDKEFFQSFWRDITEHKRMETALRESEKKYRSLVDLTSDSVYELDKNLRYTYVSGRGGDISGRKEEGHIGKTPFDFMLEEEKKRVSEFVQGKLDPPQAINRLENIVIGQDSRPVVVETSAVPIYDIQGRFSGYLCVDRDITERKQAEDLLRQSEEKYRTLFEESRDIVYITTPEGRILDMNPAGVDLLGYSSREELFEVNISRDTYWNPRDREAFQEVIAEKGFVKDYELDLKRKDGKRITVLLSANAVHDDKGTILEYRGTMHDITKRRQLEYQLHQSSKLASVGELATGVAHEINNPMATIDVHAGLIADVLEEVRGKIDDSYLEQIHKDIGTIEQQVERCRSITNNLLSFTRIPRSEGMSFDINQLLMKTTKMVSSMSLSNTDVELDFDSELPSYSGSPNLLQQVFVNLLTNAFKATETQGKITISTSLEDDENISIQFADSGHGIPKDIRERIFDPFFTTSPEGEGTGLGLSISYYIVKQLNGEISVDSTPGHGTTFVITLPIADQMKDTSIAG